MSKELTFTLSGAKQLQKAIRDYGEAARQAAKKALYQEAEDVMGRSKEEFVPVDTGDLKGSGFVLKPTDDGRSVEVQLGFGGTVGQQVSGKYVGYAAAVHERFVSGGGTRMFGPGGFIKHKIGGPKYLEIPLNDAVKGMADRIAKHVKKETGK